jgi:hypothetical protein
MCCLGGRRRGNSCLSESRVECTILQILVQSRISSIVLEAVVSKVSASNGHCHLGAASVDCLHGLQVLNPRNCDCSSAPRSRQLMKAGHCAQISTSFDSLHSQAFETGRKMSEVAHRTGRAHLAHPALGESFQLHFFISSGLAVRYVSSNPLQWIPSLESIEYELPQVISLLPKVMFTSPSCCVWVADFAGLCRNLPREGEYRCMDDPLHPGELPQHRVSLRQ